MKKTKKEIKERKELSYGKKKLIDLYVNRIEQIQERLKNINLQFRDYDKVSLTLEKEINQNQEKIEALEKINETTD